MLECIDFRFIWKHLRRHSAPQIYRFNLYMPIFMYHYRMKFTYLMPLAFICFTKLRFCSSLYTCYIAMDVCNRPKHLSQRLKQQLLYRNVFKSAKKTSTIKQKLVTIEIAFHFPLHLYKMVKNGGVGNWIYSYIMLHHYNLYL